MGAEGKIIDFNPTFSEQVEKTMTAISFENDIIHPDLAEQKELISCQNFCLENQGMIQSITLRNTVFSLSFNPVYWGVAHVASANEKPDNINVIAVELFPDDEADRLLSATSKLTLHRIVQEQVNNVLRTALLNEKFDIIAATGNGTKIKVALPIN